MAREQGSGGRKGRTEKSGTDRKKKSGWVKPDGTPLRKRKGNYFPDAEINKRKPAQRSKTYTRNDSDQERSRPSDRKIEGDSFDASNEKRSSRSSAPSRSDKPFRASEKSYGRRDSTDSGKEKPYSRRPSDSSSDRDRPSREEKPYARRSSSDSDRPSREEKPYARRSSSDSDRPSREEKPARRSSSESDRPSREEKPYARRSSSDSDRPSREEKPARRSSSESDRPSREEKPYARRSSESSSDRTPASSDEKSYSRKPSDSTSDRKRPYAEKEGRFKKTPSGDRPYAGKSRSNDRDNKYDRKGGRTGKYKDDRSSSKSGYKKKTSTTSDESENSGGIRLNKFIANAGICSRREADDLITAGVISINGTVVTELGTKVMPGDDVKFHDQTLKSETQVYVLLNKPKDYITTTDDPEERKTVMNLVREACKERIFPVGRLDRNTTGLLLLTNDGELTKRLTHPSGNIKKIYQVELDSNLKSDDMIRAAEGVELEDGVSSFDEIHYESPSEKNIIGVELHSGKNRIVRRIFETMGYKVRKLDRVYFAGLTKKDLPRGRWRFLTELEINMLKMQTGKKRTADVQ